MTVDGVGSAGAVRERVPDDRFLDRRHGPPVEERFQLCFGADPAAPQDRLAEVGEVDDRGEVGVLTPGATLLVVVIESEPAQIA